MDAINLEKIREIKDGLTRDCLYNIMLYIKTNANERDQANLGGVCNILVDRITEMENKRNKKE